MVVLTAAGDDAFGGDYFCVSIDLVSWMGYGIKLCSFLRILLTSAEFCILSYTDKM